MSMTMAATVVMLLLWWWVVVVVVVVVAVDVVDDDGDENEENGTYNCYSDNINKNNPSHDYALIVSTCIEFFFFLSLSLALCT